MVRAEPRREVALLKMVEAADVKDSALVAAEPEVAQAVGSGA